MKKRLSFNILIILGVGLWGLGLTTVGGIQALPAENIYYVSPHGNDANDGSATSPWYTINHAVDQIPDEGGTLIVREGVYNEYVLINRTFSHTLHIKATPPYKAKLQNSGTSVPLTLGKRAKNITIEGLEITRPPTSTGRFAVLTLGQGITLRNNIIHDVRDNDLLKIYGDDPHNITIAGNIFYNQGPKDEHIDVNSNSSNIFIQDNIFFNDFAGSGRTIPESFSFIVIKNSLKKRPPSVIVRRNVFLNWEGTRKDFVLVGEDGFAVFEAEDVTIENNLMIGNSPHTLQAPIGVRGSKDVMVRSNTIVGDLPAVNYGLVSYIVNDNLRNENIIIHNNIWSDPTGTMGEYFSCCDTSQTKSFSFANNLFFNAGEEFPVSRDPFVEIEDDAHRVVGNPRLGDQHDGVMVPRWNGESFDGGYSTIRQAFEDLVAQYGTPGPGSAAIDGADPAYTPSDDILGRARSYIDDTPDIGAYEAGSIEFSLVAAPNFRAISPMESTTYVLSLEADFFRAPVSITVGSIEERISFKLEPTVVSAPGNAVLWVTSTSTLSNTFGVYVRVPITATGGGQVRWGEVGLLVGGGQTFLPIILKKSRTTTMYLPLIVRGEDTGTIYLPVILRKLVGTMPVLQDISSIRAFDFFLCNLNRIKI